MNTVGFPNLNLEFTMNRFISVFGFDIAWYAIIIAVGFIIAAIYGLRRMKLFGLDSDRGIDVILAGMVGGLIGARAYYVIFSWENYKDDLLSIFAMREGGLAIYGGVIGAAVFGIIMCKIRGVKILPMLDIAAIGFLIGQGIGRWGNFVNAEAYGAEVSDNYLLGMSISGVDHLVHPCFLYESVWCLLGFVLLHLYTKHRKFDGEIGLMYLMWYGLERMIVEGLRVDSLYLGGLRVSQILSGLLLITALIVWAVIRSRIKRNNDPEYLMLYVNTEESKHVLELAELRNKDPKAYKEQERARREAIKAEKQAKKEAKLAEKERRKKAGTDLEDEPETVETAAASDEASASEESASEETASEDADSEETAPVEDSLTAEQPETAEEAPEQEPADTYDEGKDAEDGKKD